MSAPSEDGDLNARLNGGESQGHIHANMAQVAQQGSVAFQIPPNNKVAAGPVSVVTGVMNDCMSPINDPLYYRGANAYASRKTVALALVNLALLSATAGQLKSLMRVNPGYPFYNAIQGMLITCILAEIAVGILLYFLGRLNINRPEQRSRADLLQNIVLGIAVVLLVLNIMISAFGIEDFGHYYSQQGSRFTDKYGSTPPDTTSGSIGLDVKSYERANGTAS